LERRSILGLHTDAFTLIAEIIESKVKPSQPWWTLAQNAFGEASTINSCNSQADIYQSILAIDRQDIDFNGLTPPNGITILEASSDHLIIQSDKLIPIGTQLSFQLDYSNLVRSMTSPYVAKKILAYKSHNPFIFRISKISKG